ncbi:hypothetical protein [Actinocorallia longicatena]
MDSWVRDALCSSEQPVPGKRWKLSVGGIIGRHPKTPGTVRKLLGLLDDFGAVEIGPDEIGFDGTTVAWDRVIEIRRHSTADLLPDVVMDREVDRIRDFLPPVPGRKWVVTRATETLLTLVMAARGAGGGDSVIPCEIVYRNRLGRTAELPAGLFAATILTLMPAASETLMSTAHQRGIPIIMVASTSPKADRAERLRKASARLADRVKALHAGDRPAGPPS